MSYLVGDDVADLTALHRGWPDRHGEVIEVDGSNVLVRYPSGTERWKADINLALYRRPGWRLIATAPRDGTHVLLFTTCHGQVEAWFSPGEWSDHHEYGRQYDGAAWVCADDAFQIEVEEIPEAEGGPYHDGTATHWMPLPEPPL